MTTDQRLSLIRQMDRNRHAAMKQAHAAYERGDDKHGFDLLERFHDLSNNLDTMLLEALEAA